MLLRWRSANSTAIHQRSGQGACIHILKFTTYRNTSGDSGDFDTFGFEYFTNVVGCGLTLTCEIRSQNNFSDWHSSIRRFNAIKQSIEMDFIRTHAIEWRDAAHQYKVIALET